MSARPTSKQIDRSYHPQGVGMSASLKRARKPYTLSNALIGGTLVAFTLGVYSYAISAVQQDDFSDVADLLPPLEERRTLKSIEDEARESALMRMPSSSHSSLGNPLPPAGPMPYSTSSPSAMSKALPPAGGPASDVGVGVAGEKKGVLGRVELLRRRGVVEEGRGNVLVWGAPDVDRVGALWDGAPVKGKGPRVV